jgi:GNAT superfamily N-acetyltransferase
MSVTIVRAHTGHAHRIAEVIATAFHPLAVAAWLVADPDERQRALHGHMRILVEHGLRHGYVFTTVEYTAAAVWLPRTGPLPEIPDYDRRLELGCGRHADRFRALDAAFDKHHPAGPHHHLALLAVHPDHQRHGIGSALLDHHHGRLDQDGVPAYLEASSLQSRALYGRHGFTDHGPPIALPGQGPSLWPMWRRPRPPTVR